MNGDATTDTSGRRDAAMTLDELAEAAGMSTRNVRAYRTRGLLPPPCVGGVSWPTGRSTSYGCGRCWR